MGVGPSQEVKKAGDVNQAFLVERTIVGQCDFLEDGGSIRMGVSGRTHIGDAKNPLSFQGLRIGNSPIMAMKDCIMSDTSVQYTFEGDTKLHVFRRGGDVVYNLKTPTLDVTRTIDPVVTRFFKNIGMQSREIDALEPVFKGTGQN
jgi:hypothetical protein